MGWQRSWTLSTLWLRLWVSATFVCKLRCVFLSSLHDLQKTRDAVYSCCLSSVVISFPSLSTSLNVLSLTLAHLLVCCSLQLSLLPGYLLEVCHSARQQQAKDKCHCGHGIVPEPLHLCGRALLFCSCYLGMVLPRWNDVIWRWFFPKGDSHIVTSIQRSPFGLVEPSLAS